MALQAQEHPQLSDFSLDSVKGIHDVEGFFTDKIVPCLAMLKEKDFSLFNDSLLEHEQDMHELIEYKNKHLSFMDEMGQLLAQVSGVGGYTVERHCKGATANLFNAYKIEIPNRKKPQIFINLGNWLNKEGMQANWHQIELNYRKEGDSCIFTTSPTSQWVFDDVYFTDDYYNKVCEKKRKSLKVEEVERAVVILGGVLKKPLLIDKNYINAYVELVCQDEVPYINTEEFVQLFGIIKDYDLLAQVACCIEYLYEVIETNQAALNGDSFELVDEECSQNRFTEMNEKLSQNIDQGYSQYLLMKYGVFRLCRYDQITKEADDIAAIEYWVKDNPNKALFLLRAGATASEIRDVDILSYNNILCEKNGDVGGLSFTSKAHYRKFLKLPFEIAIQLFWHDTLRLKQEAGRDNRLEEILFGDEATQYWEIAQCWLEHGLKEEPICRQSLSRAFKSILHLMEVYYEVKPDKIGYALNLLYENANKIQAKIDRGEDVRDDLIAHTNIEDFLRHRDASGERFNIEKIDSKTTLNSMSNKIDKWIDDLNNLQIKKLQDNPHLVNTYSHHLMKEMVVDGCVFTPIKSNLELMLEGVEMDNCVFSFNEEIEGDCYIVFKAIYGEERATVGYTLDEEEIAVDLDQVVLRSNKRVSNKLFEIAQKTASVLQKKYKGQS